MLETSGLDSAGPAEAGSVGTPVHRRRSKGVGMATARVVLNGVSLVSPRMAGRLGLELWRRPLVRGKVRPNERAVHAAARRQTMKVGRHEVVTYEWGDGRRPVLLVHGWRSRASRFAPMIEGLLELGYSPVSYDAPGHGDSPGSAGTILDHEAIIRLLAERHGGRFTGVVANSLGVPFVLYAMREGVEAGPVVSVSGLCDFAYLVDEFCHALGLRPAINDGLRRAIERGLFGGDTSIWRRFSADRPVTSSLLVIHDEVDVVIHPSQARRLTEAYGCAASRIETTGLGHRYILADPEVVAAATAFIADRTGREAASGRHPGSRPPSR